MTYNAVINACKTGHWSQSLVLLAQSPQWTLVSCNGLLSGCEKGTWAEPLFVTKGMRDSGHVENQDCWVWIGICCHNSGMNDVEGLSDRAGKIPKMVDACM